MLTGVPDRELRRGVRVLVSVNVEQHCGAHMHAVVKLGDRGAMHGDVMRSAVQDGLAAVGDAGGAAG